MKQKLKMGLRCVKMLIILGMVFWWVVIYIVAKIIQG